MAAIRGTAEGLDQFLLAAGLVKGEHQQQVISDILNYFGAEFIKVYDNNLQHVLGDQAYFVQNILRPAALLVQAPVGLQEVGAVLNMGGENNVLSWNTLGHSLAYTAIGIVADMTRGSQYNKMMIEAFDPAAQSIAHWMDSVADKVSDQSKAGDQYYLKSWLSIAKHWNGFHDFIGQTTVLKMGRPFARVAQDAIAIKIWGNAFVPLFNAKTFAIINPGIRADNLAAAAQAITNGIPAPAVVPEHTYLAPNIKFSVATALAYQAAKTVFYDWSYNDLADTKYGLEGFAEALDWLTGTPTTVSESYTRSLNGLHKWSASAKETYFAEGRKMESLVPFANFMKDTSVAAGQLGQMFGMDKLSAYYYHTYQDGKPNFAGCSQRAKLRVLLVTTCDELRCLGTE